MASRKEGTTLGPYRIIEQVGMGGMATVYKAYQASMDRYVALKILPAHYAQDAKFVERFNREARTIAKLEHKNILPVYDFGEENGVTYLAMRYLDGGTLKDVLGLGRLTLSDAVDIMTQVCAALDYAHRQGVVHRDVKPANVMIDSEGAAYLTDFGIAKVLENVTGGGLTETGAAVGTPAYMAPEQSLGKPVDARSDIYALGVVLFEMITGRPPYQADTPMAVALAHIHEPLPLPHEIDATIPDEIESVILKALAKDPAHRYASAGEMAEALKGAMAQVGPAVGAGTTLRTLATAAGEQAATRTIKVEGDIFAAPSATQAKAPRKELGLPLWAGIAICAGIVLVAVVGLLFLLGVLPPGGRASTGAGGEETAEPMEAAGPVGEHPVVAQAYDSFDDPAFNGAFNPDLWTQPDFSDCDFAQNDGALTLTGQTQAERGCILAVGRPAAVNLDQVETVEARVQVASDHTSGYVAHGLGIGTQRAGQGRVGWQAMCVIAATPDGVSLRFAVSIAHEGEQSEEQFNEQFIAHYDTWYSLRMAVDPETMAVSCWADGDLMGSVVPETSLAAADQPVYRGIVAARGATANGTTRLDDFYLLHPGETSGTSEGQPPAAQGMVYDTFDDAAFDGAYNTALWEQDEDSICAFQQAGGVMTVPGAVAAEDMWCLLEMITPLLGEREGSLRADLLIGGDHNGGYVENLIRLGMHVDGGAWWYADCGLAAEAEDVWATFWIRNVGADDEAVNQAEATSPSTLNEPHEVRLYFDPASGTVACGVDGRVVGQAVPDHYAAALGGDFFAGLTAWRDAGAAATTFVDNFFIVP